MIAVYGCTAPAQALQATGSAAAVLPFSPVSTRACSGVVCREGKEGCPASTSNSRESGLRGSHCPGDGGGGV